MEMARDLSFNPILIYGGTDNYRHKGIVVAGWRNAKMRVLYANMENKMG